MICENCIYLKYYLGGFDNLNTYCMKRDEVNSDYGNIKETKVGDCKNCYSYDDAEKYLELFKSGILP